MVDRKQLDFGVACRAGNANRSCEPRVRRRKRERGRKRERNGERETHCSRLAGCAVALPTTVRGEEGSSGSGAEKERRRRLRGPLLPGGRSDTCSGHIVIKRLPTGPLMARDDILQVGPLESWVCIGAQRMYAGCCAQTRMQCDATDTPYTKRRSSQLAIKLCTRSMWRNLKTCIVCNVDPSLTLIIRLQRRAIILNMRVIADF